MSALGQKRTFAVQQGMSALLPIATSIAFFGISKVQSPRSIAGGFTEIMCSLRQAPGGKPGTLAKRRARERPRSHYHRAGNDRRRIAVGTDRNARAIAIPVDL